MKSPEGPLRSATAEETGDFSTSESKLFNFADAARSEKEILSRFTPEQAGEIQRKRKILSSLAYFVGKDFSIPILLNPPGGGWFWDFQRNEIKVDAKDLLEKPIDYLRFVICHEAGHRRISRVQGIVPDEMWQTAGFPFMMNAVEDCRDNNFVAEAYPRFKNQAILSYDLLEDEKRAKEKAGMELGTVPKSMQAGFEYIRQWLRDVKGEAFEIPADLPNDVRGVVEKTLASAEVYWWRYPSKGEADESEDTITAYARQSYEIAYRKIWPEFKKLVEEDVKNQEIQKALQGQTQRGEQGKAESGLPSDLKDKLTPQERENLEKSLTKAIEEARKRREEKETAGKQVAGERGDGEEAEKEFSAVIDLDALSPELKQKIRDYIDGLSEEIKRELRRKAVEAIEEFVRKIAKELEGKLVETPDKTAEEGDKIAEPGQKAAEEEAERPDTSKLRKTIEDILDRDQNAYETARQEVLPIIQTLENDLRDVFTRRRASSWKTGFKTGKKIDIKRRIQEKAKGITAVESRAWEKRARPQEKDYAISLLVDLSGSMRGEKIAETFKAVVVLSEVLNKLSINLEILGFHDDVREYQKFGRNISNETRNEMGTIRNEVHTSHAEWNDDGWALGEASKRLQRQRAQEKFLIVLSDGLLAPSSKHSGPAYELGRVITKIMEDTDQKLVGLGIGSGTDHVKNYYPSSLAGVSVKEMAEKLADLMREVIEHSDTF